MGDAPAPCLWLCGSSGVGKSTVGWEIYRRLTGAGIPTGYLDTDQVGLCYPAPADDRDTNAVKARNVGALWPTFRDAGARCLVVSGGIDTAELAAMYTGQLPDVTVTLCRLRLGRPEQRCRILRRGWSAAMADAAVANSDALDRADFVGLCVDTDGLSVTRVAAAVLARAGGWPGPAAAPTAVAG